MTDCGVFEILWDEDADRYIVREKLEGQDSGFLVDMDDVLSWIRQNAWNTEKGYES